MVGRPLALVVTGVAGCVWPVGSVSDTACTTVEAVGVLGGATGVVGGTPVDVGAGVGVGTDVVGVGRGGLGGGFGVEVGAGSGGAGGAGNSVTSGMVGSGRSGTAELDP